MLEEKLERSVEQSAAALTAMADDFFDHPEVGQQEFHAFETLAGWLEKEGFTVERGIAGMDTAFRAVWKHGEGGPNIGLLCEYDALAGLGHACGHHMQGPAILGAAKALKDATIGAPYTITVYGTPAEETISGKVVMLENGCTFEELDVALMMHGGPATQGSSSSYGSTSRRSCGGSGTGSSYGSYGSYGSGKSGGKSGKVITRRVKPKNKPVDLTKSSSASPAGSHNDLNIADVHVGDKLTHDHFGLGTVIETQDKGMNSVITVDFGNGEVKRLLLRMAPIEML